MFRSKRFFIVMLTLLLLLVTLTSCAEQPVKPEDVTADFVLALPRIVVDINSDGLPAIDGFSPQLISALSGGTVDMSQYAMDKRYIDWFTQANVQHIELVQQGDGLYIFVNGVLIPHLGWSTEDLGTMISTIDELGVVQPQFEKALKILIPFMQHTGLDVAMRFPRQPNAEEIPLRDTSAPIEAPTKEEAETEVAIFKARISFDEQGTPSILGISTRDLEDAGLANLRGAGLDPALVQRLMDAGIQQVTIKSTPEGLLFWINDSPLPYLVWNNDYLNNAADLYSQLYFMPEYESQRELAKTLLPLLDQVNTEIILDFPAQ